MKLRWGIITASWLLLIGAVVASSSGCRREAAPGGARAAAIEQSRTEGGVSARLMVSPKSLSMAGEASLTIEVTLPKGAALEPIDLAAIVGTGWTARRGEASAAREETSGSRVETQRWLLEPTSPGTIDVPEIALTVVEAGEGEATRREIAFEGFALEVSSVLAEGDAGEEVSAGKGVVSPRAEPWRWAAWGAGIAAALALVVWLIARAEKGRRVRAAEPVYRAAHELAMEALERLIASDLLDRGDFKGFYAGLSDVLRGYIEDRYGVRAPERTTEEFLHEVQGPERVGVIGAEDIPLLGLFMGQCDLVKFARHVPARADAAEAVRTVREFIDRTRSPEALVEVTAGEAGRLFVREHAAGGVAA